VGGAARTPPDEPVEAGALPPAPRRLKRRLIELAALLVLAPAVIGIRWYDDSNHTVTRDPHQRVTIVPRGAWAKLGHNQWRLLGRQEPSGSSTGGSLSRNTPPPGGAQLILLLEAKVLNAEGSKELAKMEYEVRDREGNVWSAAGAVEDQSIGDDKPAPGSTQRVKVTATVPQSKLTSVVLDLHFRPFDRPERTVLDVLRFAH
jgi:hypothetical protein